MLNHAQSINQSIICGHHIMDVKLEK